MPRRVITIRLDQSGRERLTLCRWAERTLANAAAILATLGKHSDQHAENMAWHVERVRQRHCKAVRIVGRGGGQGRAVRSESE